METSASVRPSFRRSTGRDSALADGEAAREMKPAMAPQTVRRMKSRRELPVLIVQDAFGLILRQRRGTALISRHAFAEHGVKERHLHPMANVFGRWPRRCLGPYSTLPFPRPLFTAFGRAMNDRLVQVDRLASELIELSTRHHLGHWLPVGAIYRGWTRCASGNTAEGIAWIERAGRC